VSSHNFKGSNWTEKCNPSATIVFALYLNILDYSGFNRGSPPLFQASPSKMNKTVKNRHRESLLAERPRRLQAGEQVFCVKPTNQNRPFSTYSTPCLNEQKVWQLSGSTAVSPSRGILVLRVTLIAVLMNKLCQ
jgi:hypothetical protein